MKTDPRNCLASFFLSLFLLCMVPDNVSRLGAAENTLTDKEQSDGWLLLFDGKTTNGWMSPKGQPLTMTHVQDGSLNPHPCDYMLVNAKSWENYRLSLDFKISPGCNSGVFVRTFPLTARPGKDLGYNGIEIAIDDTRTVGLHDTGAIYDLVATERNAMKAVGQWNQLLILCDQNRIEVELNGQVVSKINLDLWSEPHRRPDGSRHKFDLAFQKHPRTGFIGLQDHGADCWYQNIKILPLPASTVDSVPPTK
ncbi:MAG: DUF1080 domain-containing protein [Planctomycetales bacterium]|nr:DUF1080 domain-containing protein [Planctomycetales bacterium]